VVVNIRSNALTILHRFRDTTSYWSIGAKL